MSVDDQTHESGTSRTYSGDYERSTFEHGVEPYKDPAVLRELYHEDGMSQAKIGRCFNVSQQTISNWMDEFDIETRPPMDQRDRTISKSRKPRGKIQYHVPDGDGGRETFYQHQLVALLEFSGDKVFADDTHIHHEMGSPVAVDTPENLDVLGDREHIRLHAGGAGCIHPEIVLADIFASRDEPFSPEDPTANVDRKRAKLRQWRHRLQGENTTETAD